jgi:hypothetical protein
MYPLMGGGDQEWAGEWFLSWIEFLSFPGQTPEMTSDPEKVRPISQF